MSVVSEPSHARRRWVLPLSPQELRLALLYADGQSLKQIAVATHVTLAGVGSALHHVKVKYRNAGHEVHTKADVRERLIADGLLVTPAPTYQELIAEGLFTAAQAHNDWARVRALRADRGARPD